MIERAIYWKKKKERLGNNYPIRYALRVKIDLGMTLFSPPLIFFNPCAMRMKEWSQIEGFIGSHGLEMMQWLPLMKIWLAITNAPAKIMTTISFHILENTFIGELCITSIRLIFTKGIIMKKVSISFSSSLIIKINPIKFVQIFSFYRLNFHYSCTKYGLSHSI